MEVYIEVIVLDNLIIDYIILRICGMKERVDTRWWRLFISAILGVCIAFISLFDFQAFAMLFLKIATSVCMVFIAFGKGKFFKLLFDFYLFTFTIGGTALGLLYIKEGVNFGVFDRVANLPTGIIFGVIFCGYIATKKVIYIFNGDGVQNEYTFDVLLENKSMSLWTSAFLDTGNLLVFGEDLRGVCVGGYIHFASFLKGEKQVGQVYIATATGGDFLSVYKIERISVYKTFEKCDSKNAEKNLVLKAENVPLALSKAPISGDFKMLLSPRIFY